MPIPFDEVPQFYDQPVRVDKLVVSERLIEFLYILARDHVLLGDIEGIIWDHVTGGEADSYCNTYLEGYVRDLAQRLTDESIPIVDWKHMYKPSANDRRTDDENERYRIDIDGNQKLVER
jgi:hypothetical protein